MPFDNSLTLLARLMVVLARKLFRLGTIESRMHAGDIIERLRNPYPARQHGDIGNETDIAHEPIALGPGVASEHLQFPLVGSQAEDRVQRGGLAGAVGTDESEDAALFHPQIDAVQRDLCAEGFAQAVCFYACHGSALLFLSVILSGWGRLAAGAGLQQFFRLQAEALNGGVDPGPFFAQELLPFALQQQTACPAIDEHAAPSFGLNQSLVHQLLIALQNRERIDPIFGGDIAHRRKRVAFLENSVQYHRDHAVVKLAVNRLTVIPLRIHYVFQIALATNKLPSFCLLQLQMCVDGFFLRQKSPVFGVMFRVERGMLHEFDLLAGTSPDGLCDVLLYLTTTLISRQALSYFSFLPLFVRESAGLKRARESFRL